MKKTIFISSLLSILLSGTTLLNANTTSQKSQKHYTASVIPKHMSVQEKKARFYALLVPAVEKAYKELEAEYLATKKLVENNPNDPKIKKLMKKYSAKDRQDLLTRMKPHPRSIALAQSAMESAWGTSRFLQEANNVFGVWSFNKNEPRVAAGKKRGKTTIYVKKYATIEDSIKDYYRVLATGRAFKAFRAEKMKTNDPYKLVKYLDKYSERGAAYGKELASMIRYNKLTKYDE
jgi:Bax protein